jgi:hypothetical protein
LPRQGAATTVLSLAVALAAVLYSDDSVALALGATPTTGHFVSGKTWPVEAMRKLSAGYTPSKTGSFKVHIRPAAKIRPRGSDGYRVRIAAGGGVSIHGHGTIGKQGTVGNGTHHLRPVVVAALRHHASASYQVRGTVRARRVRAGFERFGRISVRFHRTGTRMVGLGASANCDHELKERTGFFTGPLRFHGEGRYVALKRRRARGVFIPSQRMRCRFDRSGSGHGKTGGALEASSGQVQLLAVKAHRRHSRVTVLADTQSRVGNVRISRSVEEQLSSRTFSFNRQLSQAHFHPGIPRFSGAGDFSLPRSWLGSLAVSFPGEGNVPLAGPGFAAALTRY